MAFEVLVVDDADTGAAKAGTRTAAQIMEAAGLDPTGTPGGAIADIEVSGTYATDDDAIEAAINGILAILRDYGMLAEA